ncbi:hypothetical protein A9264_03370 [Vibrio sp. UCD-FRSSP16_10]|uniref:hypothetical protein n=1 Tax=unclassified Vibrio TaxID=2614977 RepID=UPI0007FE796A|nr:MULTISPECIES: hypothetical protein [unclassified Vibrio]OBT12188.1 hypothetical protein A9260_04820 [Vibrio sp. UCD-FRSSP16_30]OBT20519.1 hypothetical protein A9264_03370 [Vibrio sp. UCD-FRSSP16_10]
MAAEKITKGRLIQIIVTFSVLIFVFTWRTIEHDSTNVINHQQCWAQQECNMVLSDNQYHLKYSKDGRQFSVTTEGMKGNGALIQYQGASYQISEFIPIEPDKTLKFTIGNGLESLHVIVNDK